MPNLCPEQEKGKTEEGINILKKLIKFWHAP
jgi:hypothetical protein